MNVGKTGSEDADFVSALAPLDGALSLNFIEDAPVGLGLLDADSRWSYVNGAFLRATGLDRAQILGMPLTATPFAADADAVRRILEDEGFGDEVVEGAAGVVGPAAATGWHVSYRRHQGDGRVLGVIAAIAGSAPEQLQELDRARRRLAAQVAAAERIGTTLDIDVTCEELAEFTVPAMADLTIVEVMPPEIAERGDGVVSRAAHAPCRRSLHPAVRRVSARPGCSARRCGLAPIRRSRESLRGGGPVVGNQLSEMRAGASAGNAEDLAAFRLLGVDSILAVPLVARGRVIGALTMASVGGKQRAGIHRGGHVLVQDLADRAAVSVESARQYTESSASPSNFSARCSSNRVRRTRISRSRPATSAWAAAIWSAATGTR